MTIMYDYGPTTTERKGVPNLKLERETNGWWKHETKRERRGDDEAEREGQRGGPKGLLLLLQVVRRARSKPHPLAA